MKMQSTEASKQEKIQTNRIKQISWNRLFVVVADKDHRTIGVRSGGGGNLGNPSGDLVHPELFWSQGTLIFLILRGLTLVPCILTCADTWQLSILPQSLTNSCSVWLTGAFYCFFSDGRGRDAVNNFIQLFIFLVMVAMPAEGLSFLHFDLKQKSLSLVNHFSECVHEPLNSTDCFLL